MITNISRSRKTALAGLESIKVVPISEIDTISEPCNGKVTCTLTSGSTWRTIYATFGTKKFGDKASNIGRQQYRTVEIPGRIPNNDSDILQQLEQYQKEGFVLLVKDYLGYQRLIGNTDEPIFFSYGEESGSIPGDTAGISFSFTRNLMKSPPYID